ncbi:DNA-J related domain-containing protein [Halorhodospira neutriphila]|uniref:J domain-containing protein n=1 Tax=Halorhodospira neutriphila TaxID=168379 RepID=A0ABS1E4N8_9GAMM|nr:DNA-J related domain-containing protein [Halorhodospira neutriphila]MBK1726167.1 hypothetical protein [Halorhodospira neutriphila]
MEIEEAVATLQAAAEPILRRHPEGVSELTLMERLAAEGLSLFDRPSRQDPEALFRAHFLLFHALYRLRPRLAEEGLDLEIHCLGIRLQPAAAPPGEPGALGEHDGLAAYYLDPANLEGMDAAAVERMIADGLRRIAAAGQGGQDEALAVLGLEAGASAAEIRRSYRRLVMRHHPDRGGDTATLQRINHAYRRLMAGC